MGIFMQHFSNGGTFPQLTRFFQRRRVTTQFIENGQFIVSWTNYILYSIATALNDYLESVLKFCRILSIIVLFSWSVFAIGS